MEARIIELAIEALSKRRTGVEAEIAMLEAELKGRTAITAEPAAAAKRGPRTAAQRKAQGERMRAYWAARKLKAAKGQTVRKAAPAKPKMGPQTAAAKKAQSERMKAYWAKRKKAEAGKVQTAKKSKPAKVKKAAEAKSQKTPF
jgi:hypothetical protein